MRKSLINAFIAIAFLGAFSSLANALPESELKNVLHDFTTDGCSVSPDSLFGTDWTNCCVKHDLHYWAGGTAQQRLDSDIEFKACMKEASHPVLANMFYLSVRAGGHAFSHASFTWGYGWKHNPGYRELTDSEKAEVQRLTPANLDDVPLTHGVNNMKPYPSETGNYCLDQALEQMKEETKSIASSATTEWGSDYATLTFSDCSGKISYSWASNSCRKPRYADHRIPVNFTKVNSLSCSGSPNVSLASE